MSETKDNSQKPTYETATGAIEFTLMSDMMFHYVMQRSTNALTGLVCALKGISPSDVKELIVTNPIDLNSSGKETIMDIKLTLNDNEILNIELQVYPDKYWVSRSIIYLCRAFDNIGKSEDYSTVKSTTLFCITDQELIKNAEAEFYAKYRLTNIKNHHLYTDKFGINVLQLNHTDKATKEDKHNNLVYWAELFKATTWEEFKALAKNHPDIEEVGNLIFELNYDNQTKEILEGQRRYREQMNSQYTAGYTDAEEKYESELAKKDAENSELQNENSELQNENSELQSENSELRNEKAAFLKLINQLDEPDADNDAILSKLRELKEK